MPTNTITFGPEQPLYDPAAIQQTYTDTCAIKCQELILNTFGKDVTEEQLRIEAMNMGIYRPMFGTGMAHMGDLLEAHGVHVATFDCANQYTLMHELAQGHQVMVALDSNELWEPGILQRILDFLGLSGANHALIVSNIDTTNPDDIQVCVTDPGTGEVKSYPFDQFADAWKDSNFHMIATTEAPSDAGFLSNFDFDAGILDCIQGLPWSEWMSQVGSLVQEGVKIAEEVGLFLDEHPEVMEAVTICAPLLMDGMVPEPSVADYTTICSGDENFNSFDC